MTTHDRHDPDPGRASRPTGGLRRALFVALALALVIPGTLAGFTLIHLNLERTLETDSRLRAERFADLLQAGLTLPLWQIDIAAGAPLLTAVAVDPAVAAIQVLDPSGTRLLGFERGEATPNDSIIVTRQMEKAGEILGQVTLTYTTALARRDAMLASFLLLTVITVQLLVSLGLSGVWLTRRVLNPLAVLRASAETIAAGDLQRAVPTLPADEFGVLASTLDSMRRSLAQAVTQLEERVEARTGELRNVNAHLAGTLADLRRTQHQLVQSEKLASLGSLVAGVAHELNTPIGTAVTLVSTLAGRCADLRRQIAEGIRRSQLDDFLRDVEAGSALAQASLERAARLVQDFKQVAVDQTSARRRTCELARVIEEMMVAVRFRHQQTPVRIEARIPDGIRLDSYPGAIEQIIANLVENAIIHGCKGRSDARIEITALASADRVTLTVADNGVGIAPEHLPRIFDPFFTTRLGKGGSGLGLSIVYGLLQGILGGEIAVDSAPGAGTVFTLEFPRIAPTHPVLTQDQVTGRAFNGT